MGVKKDKMRSLLTSRNLRTTAPRLGVLRVLADADRPLSHSEVLERIGDMDWDPATVYRNLVKLSEAGLAPIVSRVDGIDRYMLRDKENEVHSHPHFACDDCGKLICLPDAITNASVLDGPWAKAVRKASVQLRGQCPDCA